MAAARSISGVRIASVTSCPSTDTVGCHVEDRLAAPVSPRRLRPAGRGRRDRPSTRRRGTSRRCRRAVADSRRQSCGRRCPLPAPDGPSMAMMSRRSRHVRPTIMAGMSTRRARVLRLLVIAVALGGAAYWFAAGRRSRARRSCWTSPAPRRTSVRGCRCASRRIQRRRSRCRRGTCPSRRASIGPRRRAAPRSSSSPASTAAAWTNRVWSRCRGSLAAAGVTVVTVPLPDLRAYRITVRSTDMIEDAIRLDRGEPQTCAERTRRLWQESVSPEAWRLSPPVVRA